MKLLFMFFKAPSPRNLFSVATYRKKLLIEFSIFIIPIFILATLHFYNHGINEKTISYNAQLSLFLVLCSYVGFISSSDNFHQCHIRHLKLIERYGDAYLKILKTELENTTLLGHLREQWETFEKIMKEQEKLNPNIVIKRHD